MPAINTLEDLFVHQLRDIYSAERQLVAALPKMAKNATSQELKEAFTTHLQQTAEHVNRLQQAFDQLGVSDRGPKCKAMEGLIEEGKEIIKEDIVPEVLDAGLIAAARRVEHYEIASYGSVCEYARALGHTEILELLQTTLDEENATNELLTTLATQGVSALAGAGDPSEMHDDADREDSGEKEVDVGDIATTKPTKRASGKTSARKTASASGNAAARRR